MTPSFGVLTAGRDFQSYPLESTWQLMMALDRRLIPLTQVPLYVVSEAGRA
jgi:hypothetical protein